VAYVRALQRSQNAKAENLPASVAARIEQETGATVDPSGDTTATGPASD
jgi:hypothetical protein